MNTNLVKTLAPRTWRSEAMQNKYESDRQADLEKPDVCPLCEARTIESFTYWRIINNKYPYDAVAHKHEMIVPIRHCAETDLTEAEIKELAELKTTLINDRYVYLIEALANSKSIPGHHHLHLVIPKTVA